MIPPISNIQEIAIQKDNTDLSEINQIPIKQQLRIIHESCWITPKGPGPYWRSSFWRHQIQIILWRQNMFWRLTNFDIKQNLDVNIFLTKKLIKLNPFPTRWLLMWACFACLALRPNGQRVCHFNPHSGPGASTTSRGSSRSWEQ